MTGTLRFSLALLLFLGTKATVAMSAKNDYNPESDIDKIAESRRDAAQRSQENEGYDAANYIGDPSNYKFHINQFPNKAFAHVPFSVLKMAMAHRKLPSQVNGFPYVDAPQVDAAVPEPDSRSQSQASEQQKIAKELMKKDDNNMIQKVLEDPVIEDVPDSEKILDSKFPETEEAPEKVPESVQPIEDEDEEVVPPHLPAPAALRQDAESQDKSARSPPDFYLMERSARDNSPSRKQSTTDNQPTLQMSAQHSADASTMSAGIFIAVVVGCSVAGVVGLIVAGVCWYRLQKTVKATSEVDYPAYGVTGPTKDRLGSPGDRKLAQSAQMYHYQHQKQQMIAMEKAHGDLTKDGSEADSDEENDEGDYTVFECPGLAPTGEMEVKNPLFSEDTPVTPATGDTPAPAPRGAPHK